MNLRGDVWPVGPTPLIFSAARIRHMAMPWRGPRRVVIIAFTTGYVNAFSDKVRGLLAAFGFCPLQHSDGSEREPGGLIPNKAREGLGEAREIKNIMKGCLGASGFPPVSCRVLEGPCLHCAGAASSRDSICSAVGLRIGVCRTSKALLSTSSALEWTRSLILGIQGGTEI